MDDARARRAPALWLAIAVGCASLSLAAGFFIKDLCTSHEWDGFQYRSSCYNDIYALYSNRGLDRQPWPYVEGNGEITDGEVGDLEYPVATGVLVGAVASLVDDGRTFFRATSGVLAALGILAVVAVALAARDRRRALYLALAPALVLYAFHNWDLLAVAATALAFWAYARGDDVSAGVALGVGAAAKLYPGVILPAFVLARWRETRRFPVGMALAAVAAFAAINIPILVANPDGWFLPWEFQSTRFPNFETSWYFLYRHLGEADESSWWWTTYPGFTGIASTLLWAAAAAALAWRELRRPAVRPYVLAFGFVVVFLLTAKVYSPQFALWLLPLFVLVRIPWYGFVAYSITDALVWAAISSYFLAIDGAGDPEFRLWLVEIAVGARYSVLAWLLWRSRGAEENVVARQVSPVPA